MIVDIEAFRSGQAIAFQSWQRRLGVAAMPQLEVAVDRSGLVRQIVFDLDGTTVTHTLVSASTTSDDLAAPPTTVAEEPQS